MKIGVSSYSFSQYIDRGEMTQLSVIKKAKEMGFDDIEFVALTPPEGISQLEYAKMLKCEAEACGIEISAYVVSENFAVENASEPIRHIKECVDITNELGAKIIRFDIMHNYDYFRSFEEAFVTLVPAIREIADYAAEFGIKATIENHGYICQDSYRVEKLINAVNHPNFGLLADMGNFMCVDEDCAIALSRVSNLAFMVHAKDFKKIAFVDYNGEKDCYKTRACNYLMGTHIGGGIVPVAQCIEILKKAGYDGYIDIEYEGQDDCIKGLTLGLEYLRKLI